MRLRLVIRRFGLPDSHILWSSTGLNSTLPSNNAKTTIAEFLHEVDGVIPLEGEEWGIEDYVVEVGGFECVHFCAVESVLKEDDEVVIRPLVINDRRFRRVSGRVQIAADGRRLYDGVAFGRPFLRKAKRPPVRIPSIKRARITYDNECGVRADTPNQLILRDEDSDDEDDFDHHEELSAEEIADLAAEAMAVDDAESSVVRSDSRKRARTGLGIQAVKASRLHAPRSSSFNSRQWRARQHNTSGETIEESPRSVHFEDGQLDTPATILAMDDSDDSDDQDFNNEDFEDEVSDDTGNSSEKDISEANKENIAPRKVTHTTVSNEPSQNTDAATTESDETSSASESSSSSDDDSSDTDSTSFTSSDESSDSEGSVSLSESSAVTKKKTRQARSDTKTSDQPPPQNNSTEQSNKPSPKQSIPAQGKSATRKRNARRKLKRQFDRASLAAKRAHLQSKINAILPDQSQETEPIVSRDPVANDDTPDEHVQTVTVQGEHTTDTGGGVDLVPDESQDVASKPSSPPQELSIKMDQNDTHLYMEIIDNSVQEQQTQLSQEESVTSLPHVTPTKQDKSPRRTKLDLGGAKRMLFGSLGLRAPKSKDEANQLRDELKAKAQLLPGSAIGTSKPLQDPPTSASKAIVDEDNGSWIDRIDLQAVECCYEGVTYSNPPFPFVQRWDPQQHYRGNKGRGGRNKRKKRNAKQYYQDGYQYYGEYDEQHDYQDGDVTFDGEVADVSNKVENTEPVSSDEHAANDQLLEEMQAETNTTETQSDLPELPADMSTLDNLSIDQALPGCIIAFKQMEMSEHTQWCPIISEYKTAKIEAVLENDVLEVLLAARDVLRKEKKYDPMTGDRIYAKFEMQIDDDEELDERHLEIGLQDMIDPKLVKVADMSPSESNVSDTIGAAIEDAHDILTTGEEDTAPVFTSVESTDLAQDDFGEDAYLDPQVIKIEPAADFPSRNGIFKATPKRILSLLVAEDSQFPNCAETNSPQWRVGSVELGSQNPPQRFYSEAQSAILSDAIEETVISPVKADRDDAVATTEIEYDVSTTTARCDDPSIWVPNTETNKEESTRFYSLSAVETAKQSSPSLYVETGENIDAKDKEDDVGASVEVLDTATPAREMVPAPPLDASTSKQAEDSPFGGSLFVDNAFEDPQPESHQEPSMDITHEEPIAPIEESPHKDKSPAKNDSGAMSDDWNSDTDSSSLPSLKDLLSQPITRALALPQIKSKETKKNKYPKLSAAREEEEVESFVFSQAPKRLISDTHKMVVDDEVDSFVGSSYAEPPVETYELEAHVTDTGANELDDNEPELPPLPIPDRLSETPRATKKNRFASPLFTKPVFHKPRATKLSKDSKPNASNATVIDLTLSSDPADPDDASSQSTWTAASSMPQGSGWIGKVGGSLKVKGNGKGSKRNLKRTKSLV